ncbi:hypothetical protein BaRGS_00004884 [Batillaria attramentaria]|uniref:Uncharacterized protein n=1 Tax=Batillaria attramentaria TaxID=370345 RepID=A0ABD0LXC1_9CAEN
MLCEPLEIGRKLTIQHLFWKEFVCMFHKTNNHTNGEVQFGERSPENNESWEAIQITVFFRPLGLSIQRTCVPVDKGTGCVTHSGLLSRKRLDRLFHETLKRDAPWRLLNLPPHTSLSIQTATSITLSPQASNFH